VITLPSSAQIIQFPAAPVQWEAWKEAWLRQVHADSELISRDKNVSTAISWYLNRDSRDCFPKYSTIAKDICIKDRLDVRDSIKRLASRRHLAGR
jgi:hypothetical protein